MDNQNKYVKDMTVGTPYKLLLAFAIPLLIGNVFQQLYNMVDSVIVGRFVSANALGAIGTTASLQFFFFFTCRWSFRGNWNHCFPVFWCQ